MTKLQLALIVCTSAVAGCTVPNFTFDEGGAAAESETCVETASFEIIDPQGQALDDQTFGRFRKIRFTVSGGASPYSVDISAGTAEMSEAQGEFLLDGLDSESQEVVLTIKDSESRCQSVTFSVPETGSPDTTFYDNQSDDDGTVIYNPNSGGNTTEHLFDLAMDNRNQRILAVGYSEGTKNAHILGLDDSGATELETELDFATRNTAADNRQERIESIVVDSENGDSYLIGGGVNDGDGAGGSDSKSFIARLSCADCASSPSLSFDTDFGSSGVLRVLSATSTPYGFFDIFQFGSLIAGTAVSGNIYKHYVLDDSGAKSTKFNSGQGYLFSTESALTELRYVRSTVDKEGNVVSVIVRDTRSAKLRIAGFPLDNDGVTMVSGDIDLGPSIDVSGLASVIRLREVRLLPSGRVAVAGFYASKLYLGVFESPFHSTKAGQLVDYYFGDSNAEFDLSSSSEETPALWVDDAGGMLVAGSFGVGTNYRGFVGRFKLVGDDLQLDSNFGDGQGKTDNNGRSLDQSGFHYFELSSDLFIHSIIQDARGRIIIGGRTFLISSGFDWFIHRFYP